MPINNDLLNGIISGLGNIPKKSEIDTPTNNIDLEATETEAGLMSAADKKSFNELITSVSDLTKSTNNSFSIFVSLSASNTPIGSDSPDTTFYDTKLSNCDYEFISTDGKNKASFNVTNTVRNYNVATQGHDGLISKEDKIKLDAISEGANKYILPKAGSTLGGVKTTSTVTDATGLTPVPIIDGVPYYKNTTDYVLPVASNTTFGGVKTTSTVISTSGLTPCPIIAGVPYYDNTNAKYVDYVATVGPSGCTYTTILEWANAIKGTGYAFITDPNYPSDGPVENEAFLEVHSDASNTRKVVIWRRFLNSTSVTKYRFIVNDTWWNNNPWQDA